MSCTGCQLSAVSMILIVMIFVCVFGMYGHLDNESRMRGCEFSPRSI